MPNSFNTCYYTHSYFYLDLRATARFIASKPEILPLFNCLVFYPVDLTLLEWDKRFILLVYHCALSTDDRINDPRTRRIRYMTRVYTPLVGMGLAPFGPNKEKGTICLPVKIFYNLPLGQFERKEFGGYRIGFCHFLLSYWNQWTQGKLNY